MSKKILFSWWHSDSNWAPIESKSSFDYSKNRCLWNTMYYNIDNLGCCRSLKKPHWMPSCANSGQRNGCWRREGAKKLKNTRNRARVYVRPWKFPCRLQHHPPPLQHFLFHKNWSHDPTFTYILFLMKAHTWSKEFNFKDSNNFVKIHFTWWIHFLNKFSSLLGPKSAVIRPQVSLFGPSGRTPYMYQNKGWVSPPPHPRNLYRHSEVYTAFLYRRLRGNSHLFLYFGLFQMFSTFPWMWNNWGIISSE